MDRLCTLCQTNEPLERYAKCDDCFKKCTMCQVQKAWHEGSNKCPTCQCYYCDIHINIMNEYGNCPGCWIDGHCPLCFKETEHLNKKPKNSSPFYQVQEKLSYMNY